MLDSTETPAPTNPVRQEAALRFVLVFFIQVIGTVVVLLILGLPMGDCGWRRDCFHVAAIGAGGISLILLVVLGITLLVRLPSYTELLIHAVYVVNTLALSLGVARTGGPATSPFAPLISIQLSGLLLLEQHKETVTRSRSSMPLAHAGISMALWLVAHYGRAQLNAAVWTVSSDAVENYGAPGTAVWLASLGMLFTAATYVAPRNPWFNKMSTKIRAD